jgi:hypothetical protein
MHKETRTFEITVAGIAKAPHSVKISVKKGESGWLGAKMKGERIAIFYNLVRGRKTIDIEIRGPQVRHDVLAMFSSVLPDDGVEVKAMRIDKIRNQNTQDCTVTIKCV